MSEDCDTLSDIASANLIDELVYTNDPGWECINTSTGGTSITLNRAHWEAKKLVCIQKALRRWYFAATGEDNVKNCETWISSTIWINPFQERKQ